MVDIPASGEINLPCSPESRVEVSNVLLALTGKLGDREAARDIGEKTRDILDQALAKPRPPSSELRDSRTPPLASRMEYFYGGIGEMYAVSVLGESPGGPRAVKTSEDLFPSIPIPKRQPSIKEKEEETKLRDCTGEFVMQALNLEQIDKLALEGWEIIWQGLQTSDLSDNAPGPEKYARSVWANLKTISEAQREFTEADTDTHKQKASQAMEESKRSLEKLIEAAKETPSIRYL